MRPEIILGPPGCGKTTTLLNIVESEMQAGMPPDRIAFVSFTRRAADEAIERACARFGRDRSEFPYFRTIHSLCYRMLGLKGSDVLTGKKFQDFADWCGIRVTGRAWSDDGLLTGFETGDRILFMENLSRIRRVPLRQQFDEDDDGLDWNEVDRVVRALAEYKSARGLYDYTDMLTEFVRSRIRVRIDRLIVDETQDLSALQWQVIDRLAESATRVIVAGDDDQAIYPWAGADVQHLINLDGDVRVLGQSWRCPPFVQKLSNQIIANVKNRREKQWKARRGARGSLEHAAKFEEIEDLDGDTLVLARNSYILREQVEPELRRRGVVYEIAGKSSLNMDALRAAEAWERLRAGRDVTLGDARTMYEFLPANTGVKRGHKKLPSFGDDNSVTVKLGELIGSGGLVAETSAAWHEALTRLPQEDVSYMRLARARGQRLRDRPAVRLSTIHSAKGAEAESVILMSEMARRTFVEMQHKPEDEARVWYVGVTRAKSRLTIVQSQSKQECPWL